MERKSVSDRKQTMMASRVFNDILNNIQSSNLNFCLQLSPYSASISLRKSFLTDKSGKVVLPDHVFPAETSDDDIAALASKNFKLEQENSSLKKDLENSVDDCKDAYKKLNYIQVVESELVNKIEMQETIKQEKLDSENKVVKELEAEIKTLQNKIRWTRARNKRSKTCQ